MMIVELNNRYKIYKIIYLVLYGYFFFINEIYFYEFFKVKEINF